MNAEQKAALAKAMGHPLRWAIVDALDGVGRASPVVLAAQLEQPLGTVAYHVRQLHAAGILEAAGTVPRRGATEHRYRLRKRVSIAVAPVIYAVRSKAG